MFKIRAVSRVICLFCRYWDKVIFKYSNLLGYVKWLMLEDLLSWYLAYQIGG